jgi:hypothetical protein
MTSGFWVRTWLFHVMKAWNDKWPAGACACNFLITPITLAAQQIACIRNSGWCIVGFFFPWQSFLIFQQRNWEEKNSNVNSTNFVSSLLSFAKISISKRVLIRNTGLDCLNCKIANLSKPALQPFPNFLLLINCYFRWAASHKTYVKTKFVAALSS